MVLSPPPAYSVAAFEEERQGGGMVRVKEAMNTAVQRQSFEHYLEIQLCLHTKMSSIGIYKSVFSHLMIIDQTVCISSTIPPAQIHEHSDYALKCASSTNIPQSYIYATG